MKINISPTLCLILLFCSLFPLQALSNDENKVCLRSSLLTRGSLFWLTLIEYGNQEATTTARKKSGQCFSLSKDWMNKREIRVMYQPRSGTGVGRTILCKPMITAEELYRGIKTINYCYHHPLYDHHARRKLVKHASCQRC